MSQNEEAKSYLDTDSDMDTHDCQLDRLTIKKRMKPRSKPEKNREASPNMLKDSQRKVSVMDDLFKTSGVFSRGSSTRHRKKSKFWGASELMALMDSTANDGRKDNL